ncbi:hypothetical protein U9M48_006028 [Paspalum notatum var. saurae]|uniref:Cytochrome P450 n=1 Tax=Paspalum notatum var. saurae TaxID=547442 RepID=A0AAQ3PXW4_PASNO
MALLIVCFFSLVLCAYAIQLITDARRCLPPGPWPLPIVGNLLDMSNLPHRSLARLAKRHGPLMTVRLGSTVAIVASSPSTAREVLQRHNATLSGRAPQDSWRGGNHVANSVFVLQQGHRWRALRRLGTEQLFSPKRLELLEPLRRDVVRVLLRDVSEQAASGVPVSVG